MNKQATKYLAASADALAKLTAFVETYDPPDGLGSVSILDGQASYSCGLKHKLPGDVQRALQWFGDTLGREGWTGNTNYNHDGLDWKKEVGGVTVKIYDAESLPHTDAFPVPPHKFPIQIAEVAE